MKACVLCDQTVGINSTDGDSKGLGVPYEEGKLLGSFNQQNNMAEFQNSVLGDWETAVSPNRGSSGIGSSACLRKAVPGPLFFSKWRKHRNHVRLWTLYSAHLANIDSFSMLPNVTNSGIFYF